MTNKYKELLEVGQVVKNYKAMCELLNEEICLGNSRNAHIKRWERFFKYSKQGQKFIIEEVYDEEKEIIKKKGKPRTTIYSDVVQLLILDLLAQSNGLLVIGKSRLLNVLGMTNFNYSSGKGSMSQISKLIESDIKVVQDFYNTNDSNFKGILNKALDSLVNKRIIEYTIVKKGKDVKSNDVRLLTDKEISTILNIEKSKMEFLGYYDIRDLRISSDWYTFKESCKVATKAVLDIEFYFDAYKIVVNEEFVEVERTRVLKSLLLNREERNDIIEKLNTTVREKISVNSINRHLNADDSKTKSLAIKNIRKSNSYVDDIAKLTNLLIDIKMNVSIYDLINRVEEESISINSESFLSEEDIHAINEMLPF